MQNPNYKKKYLDLRSKYINDLDMAFRLGVEQGMQQSEQQQALDVQAQNNEKEVAMKQASVGGGVPNESPESPSDEPGQSEAPPADDIQSQQNGSELDQHIGKLESMLGSSSDPEVQKSLQAILSLRKAEKFNSDMKKSQAAIDGIAKALHKPAFKIGVQASHNLNDNAKKAVSMQNKIVTDIMKSWEKEEEKAANSLEKLLDVEGLLKE